MPPRRPDRRRAAPRAARLVAAACGAAALAAGLAPAPAAADLSQARTFRLKNGLTAVVLHDPSQPVVAVQTLYTVGARNETTGITGIAHFVEHMLFRGSRNFGLQDVTGVVERAGGEWHGYTYLDCTTYFEAAPRALLPALLRLEADRMTAARMAPDEVEPERGAVFQEYRGYQLDPRTELFDEAIATLFMQHPYRNNTMGWESDLAGITHEDLVEFYRRYYGPGNAVLAIAGDFDPRTIEAQVDEAFGSIPAGGASTAVRTVEPPLTGQRRITLRRRGADPAVMVSFQAPPPSKAREYARLMVLDAILGSAKGLSFLAHSGDSTSGLPVEPGSRLAVVLEAGDVTRAGTAYVPTLYPYHYSLYATPLPGADPDAVAAQLLAVLAEAAGAGRGAGADRGGADGRGLPADRGITREEVDAARRRIEAALLLEIDGSVEVTHEMAFWTGLGGLRARDAVIAALRRVGPDEVRALAASFDHDRAVVAAVLPLEAAAPTVPEAGAGAAGAAADPQAAAAEPPVPGPGVAAPVTSRRAARPVRLRRAGAPAVETVPLPRGGRAIVDARPGMKTFVLKVAAGAAPDRAGAAGTADRLQAAASRLGADRTTLAAWRAAGVQVEIAAPGEESFAERDTLQIVLQGPAADLAGALDTLGAALESAFAGPPDAPGAADPAEPPRDPAARALWMLEDTLAGASPAETAGGGAIVVTAALVSPYTAASARPLLDRLGAAAPESADAAGIAAGVASSPRSAGTGLGPLARRVEAMPAIAQGRLLFAFPFEGDADAAQALAWILHHAYSGRLGAKAIAEMGLVYSMSSGTVRRGRPLVYVTMGASPESLGRLEAALARVLDDTAATLTDEEIAAWRSVAAGDAVVRLSDPSKAAALWTSALLRGEGHAAVADAAARAARLTRDEVARAARRMLAPDNRLTIVVTRDDAPR